MTFQAGLQNAKYPFHASYGKNLLPLAQLSLSQSENTTSLLVSYDDNQDGISILIFLNPKQVCIALQKRGFYDVLKYVPAYICPVWLCV